MMVVMEAGPAWSYLEDTDGHCYASNRDEVPLNPFLPRPQTAALVDNIGIVLPLEVSQTRQAG